MFRITLENKTVANSVDMSCILRYTEKQSTIRSVTIKREPNDSAQLFFVWDNSAQAIIKFASFLIAREWVLNWTQTGYSEIIIDTYTDFVLHYTKP